MYWPGHDPIYVSHADLTAFAWSAPMRDLASKVGISDVGLKKLLKSHCVVTPPQGHWNRVLARRPIPEPPKSPPRRPGETGRIRLDRRFRNLFEEAPAFPVNGPFASKMVPEALEDLRAQEVKAIGRATVSRDLDNPHAGLRHLLGREAKRRENARERWHWDQPVFDTPLDQRGMKLFNGLLNALTKRGCSGSVEEQDRKLRANCCIGDMTLGLTYEIIGQHRTETISGCRRPARDLPASTPIRLSINRAIGADIPATWQDDARGKLETKLAAIAADLIVAGEAAFRQSLVEAIESEEQQRIWDEERRQKRIAELEAKRLEDLKVSGRLLAEADEVRTLVKQVRAAALAGRVGLKAEDLSSWEEWARSYADRLDPIISGQIFSHLRVPELDDQ